MVGWGGVGLFGAGLARVSGRDLGRIPLAAACGIAGLGFGAVMNLHMWVTYSGDHTAAKLGRELRHLAAVRHRPRDRQRHLLPRLRARAGARACAATGRASTSSGSRMPRQELPYSASWTLADHVDRAAALWSNREALVYGAERLTFGDFADATFDFARSLRALGVEPGDAVGVVLPNGIDALIALYGATRLGAIVVPLDITLTADELHELVPHADLRILIAEAEHADALSITDAPELRHVVRHGLGANPECISWEELKALSTDVPAAEVRQRAAADERRRDRDDRLRLAGHDRRARRAAA